MGKVKTGIVMMNLGGPANLDEVEPFLLELFADHEIIQLPFQSWLGPFIARRRTPRVKGLYASIGGGSPILRYTRAQGQGRVAIIEEDSLAFRHGRYAAIGRRRCRVRAHARACRPRATPQIGRRTMGTPRPRGGESRRAEDESRF